MLLFGGCAWLEQHWLLPYVSPMTQGYPPQMCMWGR